MASSGKQRVLILCTGNSCRSIMGEALFNADERFQAFSAGSAPAGAVHPRALKVIAQHGLSLENPRSKSWLEFSDQPFDYVITVCDSAAQAVCPAFPGKHIKLHWSTPDPALATGSEETIQAAFESAFQHLRQMKEKEFP